ncbi:MAG: replication factor C small subunit, partial [Candidatus Woesearchaeota archaeon]
SDERGIDVVRVKVKEFARTKALGDVPFKIIYLDECDALTREAQQALRRTMENYSGTCRFILSCNYSSKIIEPIQSRCAVFRFKPLSKEDIFEIIDGLCVKEKLSIDEKAKHALVEVSEGDVRKLENIMQACAVLSQKLTEEIVFEVAGYARPKEIGQILEYVVKKDFEKAKNKLLDTMLNYGLSGMDVIKQLHKEVWKLNIPDLKKLDMIKDCAEVEFRMVEGSDEFLQLESLIAKFILIVSKQD